MKKELEREKQGGLIAQLMAFSAGAVDATGYIALFHIFTANMSGNMVKLGIELPRHEWASIFHKAFPIPVFAAGVVFGSFLIELSLRHNFKKIFSTIFLLEAVLIGLFLGLGGKEFSRHPEMGQFHFYSLALLPILAMGLQNAALHRIGSFSIRTTFVTGMIITSCKEFVRYLFWLRERSRPGRIGKIMLISPRQVSFVRMTICGAICICYLIGAAIATFIFSYYSLYGLIIPILALITAIVINFWRGEIVRG